MNLNNTTPIQRAIDEYGPYTIARWCGLRGPSIYKWRATGRLPRTEWTGETDYATTIAANSEGKFTREELLKRIPAEASCQP